MRSRLVRGSLLCLLAIAVFLTPGVILILSGGPSLFPVWTSYERPWEIPLRLLIVFALCWRWVWTAGAERVLCMLILLALELAAIVRLCSGPHSGRS